ncbi:MAG: hypothetical protein Q8N88_05550 [Nanoarchaeota archaeon]|nr:hypothetical protein [Nanoarchaeota archaeon]
MKLDKESMSEEIAKLKFTKYAALGLLIIIILFLIILFIKEGFPTW